MWMYRTLASRYHQTHLYLARLYHQKYKIESIRISLSHSSSSTRIHSCLTSKPINSNILPPNIKIRPTQRDSFYSSVICIRLQKSESISSLKAHADNNLSGQQGPLFFLLRIIKLVHWLKAVGLMHVILTFRQKKPCGLCFNAPVFCLK